MAGRNSMVVRKAFKGFDKEILDATRSELNQWCWKILESAVRARENNPNAHDFTGNLLNSIVVCLYEKGEPYAPYFASDLVASAIRPKMKKRLRKRIFFNPDYSGTTSVFLPTVETNGGWGRDDANRFFASFKPKGNNMFDVVVAYTVEYADWVEIQRKTTGFLETNKFTLRTGLQFLKLKNAA